jgi:hypothetical protein
MKSSNNQFLYFIIGSRLSRFYCWGFLSSTLLFWFVFKYFYPYPNMVMDSYVYVKGAVLNLGANSFPIGYSKFLQLFGLFSRSTGLLVWLQYLLLESAYLLLFFTLLYFFRTPQLISNILFAFLFWNPLFLFVSNFIMSDALFTALSIFWICQLIWLICDPRPYMIWIQAGLLFLAFTIRYNALYYPLVACLALLLTRLSIWYRIAAILLQFIFIGAFSLFTRSEMLQLTGERQFSPFGGWQVANNALYMYGHIQQETNEPVPAEFQSLDSIVRQYFNSTHRVESLLEYDAEGPGFFYMVSDKSPLLKYMYRQYGADTLFQDFKGWGKMGVICSGYGAYLVRRHPLDFARYWMLPNAVRYFYPPTEIFSMYSPYIFRQDEFGKMAMQLFDLKTLAVGLPLINLRTSLLSYYPSFFMLLNLFFVFAFTGFCLFGGLKKTNGFKLYTIGLIAVLWTCNFFFAVTASCIVLRYQIFIMIVEFPFALVLTDFIYRNNPQKMVKPRE